MRRLRFVAFALGTISLGLLVHRGVLPLPDGAARDVAGDLLWGTMMAWWVGAAAPRARLTTRALVATGICTSVELLQLVRHPVLDAVRATTPGHLVLGSDFDARDLAAYAAGVALAAALELAMRRRAVVAAREA